MAYFHTACLLMLPAWHVHQRSAHRRHLRAAIMLLVTLGLFCCGMVRQGYW